MVISTFGKAALGYESIHGGCGFGKPNTDGKRMLQITLLRETQNL